jgi:xylan 1,4-beta-xylosidase
LDKIKHVGSAANSMSYWTFTDIFEEAGPRTTPFHGGFGLMNYQDLPKPAYFAYKYLNRLGTRKIECRDADSLLSRGDNGSVQVLFWDFTITHPGPSAIDQEYYKTDHPAKAKGSVEVKITNLLPGRYLVKAHRVGFESNDVYTAWHKLGSPSQLTKQQVVTLQKAADDTPIVNAQLDISANGVFDRTFEMRENDVWLVELFPLKS